VCSCVKFEHSRKQYFPNSQLSHVVALSTSLYLNCLTYITYCIVFKARYSLSVLEVPLNCSQSMNQPVLQSLRCAGVRSERLMSSRGAFANWTFDSWWRSTTNRCLPVKSSCSRRSISSWDVSASFWLLFCRLLSSPDKLSWWYVTFAVFVAFFGVTRSNQIRMLTWLE